MSKINQSIGVLGGGQLGRMLVEAAAPLGLDIRVLDVDGDYPAAGVCPKFYEGSFLDFNDVVGFGQEVDILTVEIENVNIEAIKYLEGNGTFVYPQSFVLEIIVDKGVQKQFYLDHGLPTAPAQFVKGKSEIMEKYTSGELKLPFVQKIRVGGYDGRGVYIVKDDAGLSEILDGPSIIEPLVAIRRELAVIVARSVSGEVKVFPVVEMQFHPTANLVEFLFCPSKIEDERQKYVQDIARDLAIKLGIVGLLAVELFEDDQGNILINECAPRPHNSGHHSIEACITSQFEQHLRAILDLPLGDADLIMPCVMINVLGESGFSGAPLYEGIEETLKIEGVYPHLYGKKNTKPFRKMGHVTIMDHTLEEAISKAKIIQQTLKVKA